MASGGCSLVAVCRLLIAVASHVVELGPFVHGLQQLQYAGSVVVAHGLSCPKAMWESSWTRDQTSVLCFARQILNYWTTR